ncbi:transposase, partial [Geobacillus stearothermophilus]
MYRTLKTRFQAKKEVIQKLFECNRISAEVWNECLRLAKEHHLETGKWITKTELQKATKGRFSIHSQSIQAVVHKYIFARDGAKE